MSMDLPIKQYNGVTEDQLRQQLVVETDSVAVNNIVKQLNTHLQKKDVIRKSYLSDVQDKVCAQIDKRITEKAGNFSNKDLIDYFKVINDAINNIDSAVEAAPQVNIDTKINVNMDKPALTAEEKRQVTDAVRSILNQLQTQQIKNREIINGEFTEINEQ